MKISVIMSVHNGQYCLPTSIESILNQSYKDFEFLIMDDNSNDDTYELLKKYQKFDSRIKIFQNKINLGLTKSLNILLLNSQGKYVARQDADDISEINRLSIQYKTLENSNYQVCSTRAKIIQTSKKIPGLSFYIPIKVLIKYKNPIIHGTIMADKNILQTIGNYNEKFYFSQDYKLIYDLLENNIKIKQINKPLYHLNMNNNISTIFSEEQKYYADCVRKKVNPEIKN